jgi:hypothetical protein
MLRVYGIVTRNNTTLLVKGQDRVWRLPGVQFREKVDDAMLVASSFKKWMKETMNVDIETDEIAYENVQDGKKSIFLKIKHFSGKINENIESQWVEMDHMNKGILEILPSHKNAVLLSTLK